MESESLSTTQSEPQPVSKKGLLPVIELFGPVIQGEGNVAGQKTMFLRLGGCDSRCRMCDSLHAVLPQAVKANATYMSTTEIVGHFVVAREMTGTNWVSLSGGNPVMHNLTDLVVALKQRGFKLAVETQGTLFNTWLRYIDVVTVSPKGPGMGEVFDRPKFEHFLVHLGQLHNLAIKVVVFDQRDLEFALEVEGIVKAYTPTHAQWSVPLYLSVGNPLPPVLNATHQLMENPAVDDLLAPPAIELLDRYRILAEDVLQDVRFIEWRFLPQLHVLMFGNEACR